MKRPHLSRHLASRPLAATPTGAPMPSRACAEPVLVVPDYPETRPEIADQDLMLEAWSDGRIWEEGLVVREINLYTEQALYCLFEIGRRLIWTREVIGHSQFGDWCMKKLPFGRRNAERYMQIARWFSQRPGLLKPLARLGLRKAVALTTLPPDVGDALLSDGHVPGLDLEEVEDLPYCELHKRVEELRADADDLRAERTKLADRLSEAEGTVARLTTLQVTDDDAAMLREVARLRERAEKVLTEVCMRVRPMAARALRGELSPLVRADVVAFATYLDVLVRNEILVIQAAAGEEVWSGVLIENMERPRPLASRYTVPNELLPPAPDEDPAPARVRKPKEKLVVVGPRA